MKKIVLLLFLLPSIPFAQEFVRPVTVIDTPTAFTISRGTYQLSMLAYDEGGMEMKTFVGLHDAVFIGISFDIEHALGKEDPHTSWPGAVAKLKFTDGWDTFPISFAIGFDSFFFGSNTGRTSLDNEKDDPYKDINRMVYGPYAVVTKPIFLGGGEQYFSFGIRMPARPYVPQDSSYFLSLDIPMGGMFTFKTEGERIYYNFRRHDDWLWNLALRLNFIPNAGIDFCVILQNNEKPNRIIRVEYTDAF